jgi:hypothetical protein
MRIDFSDKSQVIIMQVFWDNIKHKYNYVPTNGCLALKTQPFHVTRMVILQATEPYSSYHF